MNSKSTKPPGYLSVWGYTLSLLFRVSPAQFLTIMGIVLIRGLTPGLLIGLWQGVYQAAEGIVQDSGRFFTALIVVLGLMAVDRFIEIGSYTIRSRQEAMMAQRLMGLVHRKAVEIPLESFENPMLHDQLHRVCTLVDSKEFTVALGGIFRLFIDVLSGLGVMLALVRYSPYLALLAALSVLPLFLIRWVRGKDFLAFRREQTGNLRYLGYLRGLFTAYRSAREMRVYGFDQWVHQRWSVLLNHTQDEEMRVSKHALLSLTLGRVSTVIGLGLAIVLAMLLMANGALQASAFAASVQAFLQLQELMIFIILFWDDTHQAIGPIGDLLSLLRMEVPADGEAQYSGLAREIVLKDVRFSYGGDDDVLQGIDLTIPKGQTLAIVGVNGAGKSTLVKILLGLFRPTSGDVLIDGVPLKAYRKDTIYQRRSAVMQSYLRYALTMRENIAMGDLNSLNDDEALMGAAAAAGIEQLIQRLPDGLNTLLGKEHGGQDLSGGEWQRVAIARALIRDAEWIALDEPTAALDPAMEYEVFQRFIQMVKGRTAVIVSHRIGSARLADRIAVMREGRIVEIGSHDELLEQNGEYRRLFEMQAQWYREGAGR